MRALFDYDPREDELVPCVQAGVPFKAGDILQVGAGIHDLCAAAAVATLFLLFFALLIYVFLISAIWWAAVSHLVPVIFTF